MQTRTVCVAGDEELANLGIRELHNISIAWVIEILTEYRELIGRYESLSSGASLDLVFEERNVDRVALQVVASEK